LTSASVIGSIVADKRDTDKNYINEERREELVPRFSSAYLLSRCPNFNLHSLYWLIQAVPSRGIEYRKIGMYVRLNAPCQQSHDPLLLHVRLYEIDHVKPEMFCSVSMSRHLQTSVSIISAIPNRKEVVCFQKT
jgi:hypothetical protein